MISRRTKSFHKLFDKLPIHIKLLAKKNYKLWLENPKHPSLNYERIGIDSISVRIGDHYRALGFIDGEYFYWFWIGSHEDYNNLI